MYDFMFYKKNGKEKKLCCEAVAVSAASLPEIVLLL